MSIEIGDYQQVRAAKISRRRYPIGVRQAIAMLAVIKGELCAIYRQLEHEGIV